MRGVVVCLFVALALSAQSADKSLTLDAVSIKVANGVNHGPPGSDGGPGTRYPELFGADATVRKLIGRAYGLVDASQQVSGPGSIDSPTYAIDARVPKGTTVEQFRQMLQNLLAERFGLVVHHDTKILSGYDLVVAKSGLKIKESPANPDDAPPPPPLPGFPNLSGPGLNTNFGPGPVAHMRVRQQPLSTVARALSGPSASGSTVIDKTGLTGKYDFTLSYQVPLEKGETDAPSIFDAVQEQLGLRLVPAKEPFDLIVVDHVEKSPTEN
jgi:uncharacterized protein (TIGR03435 family)